MTNVVTKTPTSWMSLR